MKFQNFEFCQLFFFFFFVNMGPYGRRNFKRHLVWKYTRDLLPKIQVYSWEWSLPKVYKELKFQNLEFAIFLLFLFRGRLTWESIENYKKCDISGTAGRRAKRTKIWASGVCISIYMVLLKCSSSVWGHSLHFRILVILYMYLGNG